MSEIDQITEVFERQAERADYRVIYSAIDKGGAFEWRAIREGDFKRYVFFAVLPEWKDAYSGRRFAGLMVDVEGRISADSGHAGAGRVVLKYSDVLNEEFLFGRVPELIKHVFDQAEMIDKKDFVDYPFRPTLHAEG